MSHWWRAYEEAVDDPKLCLLSDKQHRAWFNLLCVASSYGGVLPSAQIIAVKLRMPAGKASELIGQLTKAGLFEENENGDVTPHNWKGRQYKSDVSTDRVKRFRQQQRNVSSDVSETVSETVRSVSVSSSSSLPSLGVSLGGREGLEEPASGPFDQFWALYPNKTGKKAARKKFDAAIKTVDFERLMAALRSYVNKTDDRPWCNPETWLNQGRWDDEPAIQQRGGVLGAIDRLQQNLENSADSEADQNPLRRLSA